MLCYLAGGFGAYSKKPKEIGRTVARWLKDPELLEKMKLAALRVARPKASYDIAREIARMLFYEHEHDYDYVGEAAERRGDVVHASSGDAETDGGSVVDGDFVLVDGEDQGPYHEVPNLGEGAAAAVAEAVAAGSHGGKARQSGAKAAAADHAAAAAAGWGATIRGSDEIMPIGAMAHAAEEMQNMEGAAASAVSTDTWSGAEAAVAGAGGVPGRVEATVG